MSAGPDAAPATVEQGWLPDYLYRDGRAETGLAMFADLETGRITRFSSKPADLAKALRLPEKAIFPGLVNAHSHAFQRAIRGRTEQASGAECDSFWTWREAMYRAAGALTPADVFEVSRMAFCEMVRAGITTVGEFHYLQHAPNGARYDDPNRLVLEVIRAAQETGIRIALLRAAYFRAGWKTEPNARQTRFLSASPDEFLRDVERLRAAVAATQYTPSRVWIGVAPHSVRAVPLPYLIAITEQARKWGVPVHMHVAEQPGEIEACVAEHRMRPVELLESNGMLDGSFTAIHATHVTGEEIRALARANICACPTTERNLGDGIGAADEWVKAGANICLGSDSNIQIDLLEDARELEYHLRLARLRRAILSPDELFRSATRGGAQSLQAAGGDLVTGKAADFFTVDLRHPSICGADAEMLLPSLVFGARPDAICDVFVGGKAVMRDRSIPEEEAIGERFRGVMRRLWRR